MLSLVSPGNEMAWIYDTSARISGRSAYPAVLGGKSVIRLSLGKPLVIILQGVKRTNTPLIPKQRNGVVDRPWFFGVVGSNPTSTMNKLFRAFPMSNLKNALPGIPRK